MAEFHVTLRHDDGTDLTVPKRTDSLNALLWDALAVNGDEPIQEASCTIYVTTGESMPEINLDPYVMRVLGDLSACLDIDIIMVAPSEKSED